MTNKESMLNILKDGQWHCSHEFSFSSQPAAIVRDLRNDGYEFEKGSDGDFCEYKYCERCGKKKIHRKLKI